MLLNLKIHNYTLIDELNIQFTEGFSVITGETGSGKSILLGALSLMLGKRADTQVLLDKSRKCIVEATFRIKEYGLENFFIANDLDFEENTIIRREINQQGNSRAFINDTPVNLTVLKELGEKLIDIHSQHKTLTLNDSGFQLDVVDNYAQQNLQVKQYKAEFVRYTKLENELSDLIDNEKKSKADQDYFQFQFEELESANLIEGEQEILEKELEILNHSEEIKKNLFIASGILSNNETNLIFQLNEIKNLIRNFIPFHSGIKELSERIHSSHIELQDIAKEVERIEDSVSFDPVRMQHLHERLDLIFRLQQKHRVASIRELLEIKETISNKLLAITSLDENITKLKNELLELFNKVSEQAKKISGNRLKVIPKIEKEIESILSQLGMPEAQLKISREESGRLTNSGIDKIVFLFSANKGHEPKELSKVASGGELSRLMLSIKSLISQRNLLPTIIFDEIDMGVSGNIANKIGIILQKMSKQLQLIVITHLPQIAGKGDIHYMVYKQTQNNLTKSMIKKLDEEERVDEISKMLSGEKISQATNQAARELLE